MTLGKHCFTEVYECPGELLDDEDYLKEHIIQSLNKTSLTLLEISSHKFEPQGVTIEVAMMHMIEALKARDYNLKCIKR